MRSSIPTRTEGGLGTLFIPNTLAIIKRRPAIRGRPGGWSIICFRPAVEAKLAAGPSAQIPLNPAVSAEVRVETPATIRPMPVDFDAAAAKWDAAAKFLRDEFTGG